MSHPHSQPPPPTCTRRVPMRIPKPVLAVSLAVLSLAVSLGCFAQVF
ncbi:hypothetical protein [Peterkaempfera griseoplana]|nr:hypothetical protein [Peterkaempfera griseoplana]